MKIRLRALGALAGFLGEQTHRMELPEGSTLQSLMKLIDERWAAAVPGQFWDRQGRKPAASVIIIVDGRPVKELRTALREDQEVMLLQMVAGG